MFADLARREPRRLSGEPTSARELPDAEGLPEYFTQDFHYQTGGYLSEDSARLYDVQVETLFYGAAAMRRAAIPSIAEFLAGRDQRRIELLDVARHRALPAPGAARVPGHPRQGPRPSRAYLAEARRHLEGLRPVELVAGNAEQPVRRREPGRGDDDLLYHELPAEVRRRVTAEIARV